ncbi:platelet factor 4-like [Mesocricetus auratus]|uniref:Multifunctional fusion protein n=1 Tax=Mesocricetus auratus TaxID=10036 RepID=A0ABM2XKP6_MESAU|nr:platelet factor 4-like [Mesocricetus auratus]
MSATAVCRGPCPRPGLLLLGLLFLPAVIAFTSASPEEGDADLHCVCVKTISSGIHPKHITTLEVIKAGRHCAVPQLIATLKNGRKICLDRQAPLYKKVIKKLLES